MNVDRLRAAGVDYDAGLKRMCGNETLYQKFLKKFPEDKSIGMLKESLEKEAVEEAFHAAHTLKGVSGTLSLAPLYEKSSVLCETLRKGELADAEEIAAVYETYDAIIKAISEEGDVNE